MLSSEKLKGLDFAEKLSNSIEDALKIGTDNALATLLIALLNEKCIEWSKRSASQEEFVASLSSRLLTKHEISIVTSKLNNLLERKLATSKAASLLAKAVLKEEDSIDKIAEKKTTAASSSSERKKKGKSLDSIFATFDEAKLNSAETAESNDCDKQPSEAKATAAEAISNSNLIFWGTW